MTSCSTSETSQWVIHGSLMGNFKCGLERQHYTCHDVQTFTGALWPSRLSRHPKPLDSTMISKAVLIMMLLMLCSTSSTSSFHVLPASIYFKLPRYKYTLLQISIFSQSLLYTFLRRMQISSTLHLWQKPYRGPVSSSVMFSACLHTSFHIPCLASSGFDRQTPGC